MHRPEPSGKTDNAAEDADIAAADLSDATADAIRAAADVSDAAKDAGHAEDTISAAGHGVRALNLRQIEVFRAIMIAGSISAAGRMLHVSQPAISRVLALSESRLGYPLFERVKSRLIPTQEARRLYGEVERVYVGIQRVNDLAASLGQDGAGTLRVVASATFGQRLVPQAVQRFRQRHPRVQIDFRSATYDEMEGYFLSGKADVGISIAKPDHPNLTAQHVGIAQVVCVVPDGHPLCSRTTIHADDLTRDVAWIGYPVDTPLGRAIQPFLQSRAASAATIEVHSPVTACSFVQQGLGPAMVDSWSLVEGTQDQLVRRPIHPAVHVDIWATHSNLDSLSLMGRRFLEAVRAVLDAQAASGRGD